MYFKGFTLQSWKRQSDNILTIRELLQPIRFESFCNLINIVDEMIGIVLKRNPSPKMFYSS